MGRTDSSRLLTAAALGIALAYGLLLAQFLLHGQWILDRQRQPIITDFLPVYMAGKLALSGHAATAYDWRAFHGIQAHFVGHPFAGFLGWHYPPLHFLVAMALALLPYPAAFLGWTVLTLAAFAWAVNRIVKGAAIFALALPPVLACALVGQNGFFSAALLGAMLLCLPARPLLAGFVLAALTFKPQFGLLMPFALLAGGYWRTLAVAAVLALAWIGIGLVVSPSSFAGFLHYLPQTGQAVLNEGTSGWGKLQSIYAAVRLFGGNGALAWGAQIAFILAAIGFCVWLWRRDVSFALKAAALSAGVLLATPYVYFYDLPLLAVPLAFLWRDRAFDLAEHIVGGVIFAVLAAFTFGPAPWGLVASLLAVALVVRRSA